MLDEAAVKEGHPGRSFDRGEHDVDGGHPARAERGERGSEPTWSDVAEGEVGEVGPESAPPAGEEAGACGGVGAAEANEDLEKQILREGAEEVGGSAA
jgi:hypothetical protein